jgi:hypothetical protein
MGERISCAIAGSVDSAIAASVAGIKVRIIF